jgi:predicted HAD superfamily Cof-like phosphohydrolase
MTTPAHIVQVDVEDFHRALGLPIGDTPAVRRPELRAKLIMEEAAETAAALTGRPTTYTLRTKADGSLMHTVEAPGGNPLVATLDGLCDILCVTYGTAVEAGCNLAPYWDEVHRSNMAKQGGPVREDGKQLKPPGWKPPDLAAVLNEELNQHG